MGAKRNILSFLLSCFSLIGLCQMNGVYTVPGSFSSLAATINSLNSVGVSGPVIINIAAGYTETCVNGGFNLSASGSATSPIIFKKSGVGANPLLVAYSGGTAVPTSILQDGVWRLIGSDYCTIDGIDIFDPNLTNPSTMEYGYGLFVSSGTNGCQYDTIRNCKITLNRNNNVAGFSSSETGSRGINMLSSYYYDNSFSVLPSNSNGTNSFNGFYSNEIENCAIGITIRCTNPSTFSLACQENDVGGGSPLSGNRILNFGGAPISTYEAFGITISDQWNANVSNNIINNNNGNGFHHPFHITGINIVNSANANSTVSNNTISIKIGVVNTHYTAIRYTAPSIANSTGTIQISNNLVTNCSQTVTSSTGSGAFYGIHCDCNNNYLQLNSNKFLNNTFGSSNGFHTFILKGGTTTQTTSITNNLIRNSIFSSTASIGSIKGISVFGNYENGLTIQGNTLSATTNTYPTGGQLEFITCSSVPKYDIKNNVMDSVALANTGSIYFIKGSGVTTTLNIKDNRMTNVSNINVNSSGGITGIYCVASGTNTSFANVSFNYINNVSVNSNAPVNLISVNSTSAHLTVVNSNTISSISNGTLNLVECIGFSGGKNGSTVNNNLVKDISGYSAIGISIGPSSVSVISNSISGINATNFVRGMFFSGVKYADVSRNRLFNIQGSTAGITGLEVTSLSGKMNIYNNLIGDLKCPTCVGQNLLIGVNLISSSPNTEFNVYYNTIYINATSSSSLFTASGIKHNISNDPTLGKFNIRNNIIVNRSVPIGSGIINCTIERYLFNLDNYDPLSNNNLLFAGNSSTSCSTYFLLNTNLTASKPLVAPREANSFSEDPVFVSINGNHPNFLKPNPNIFTQIESSGTPIPGFIDDYLGNIRNTNTPDVGAWENYYLLADTLPPTIKNIAVSSGACNYNGVTFTANIIDQSGVPTNSLAPRCYYKINNGPYTSVQGLLSSGNTNNGIWSFPVSYTVTPGDVLGYFVVAQDVINPTHINSLPANTLIASSVNSITSYPTSPFTLTIQGILNGTYTVGAAGNFTTLTSAVNAYNNWCITGPVTFLLTDPAYSINETFPITIKKSPYASQTNSLLIRPANSINTSITAPFTSTTALSFLDARYIQINGIGLPGTSLKVSSTNTINSSVLSIESTNSSINAGCRKVEIKNLIIIGADKDNNNQGISSIGKDNDSMAVNNNTIINVFNGISANGTASVSNGGMDNWIISNNVIGMGTGTNAIGRSAIELGGASTNTICNNLLQNIESNTINSCGISILNCSQISVYENTITAISCSAATSGQNSVVGIKLFFTNSDILVDRNFISNISNTSPTGYYGARGITLHHSQYSNNIKVQNNFISDIFSRAGLTEQFMPIGICVDLGNGYEINNNTVHLGSNFYGYVGSCASAALAIASNGNNIKVRNNILSNYYDNTNSNVDITYAIYSSVNNTSLNLNYNDYMVGGNASTLILGYKATSNYFNLSQLQTGFGNNANSINVAPVFVSASDLHLVNNLNPLLNDQALALNFVAIDIDGQLRSLTNPDIGADEFYSSGCSSATSAITSPVNFTTCEGQSIQLSATVGSGNGLSYQWKSSTTSGGPYSSVTNGSGANTTTYTSGAMNTGNYYFIMETTCSSASLIAISNEVSVMVNPTPALTITPTFSVCSGNFIVLNSINSSSTILWNGPQSFTSTAQNPTITAINYSQAGIYTVSVTQLLCVATGTTFVNVVTPTIAISNTGPSCAGYTVQFNSTAANGYTWTGPNSFNSNSQNPLIVASPSVAGVYSLNASQSACAVSATTNLIIDPTPTAVAFNNAPVCAGKDLIFNSNGGTTYTWYGPNSFTSSVQNPTITNITNSGTGNYTLIVSNSQYCSSQTISTVLVNPSPTLSINYSTNSVCIGSSATLLANGATSYTWSTNSNSAQIVVTPNSNTSYTLVGENPQTCTASVNAVIYVNQLPNISIQTTNTILCAGNSATLIANGANTYSWSNSGTGNVIVVNPTSSTNYTVVGLDNNGCENTASITQSVDICTDAKHEVFSKLNYWSIHPNPANNVVYIKVGQITEDLRVEVSDEIGKKVIQLNLTQPQTYINIEMLANGVYFIKLYKGKEHCEVKKLIKY